MANDKTLNVEVWRGAEDGRFESFEVPARDSQTVLDVVSHIQRHLDETLTYRFACRVGMCGSCAMTVNGRPRWTCRTHVSRVARNGRLTIAPLRNLPVIKDLACDMTPFFDKWQQARAVFDPSTTRDDPVAAITPDSPKRREASAAIECINCAVCYAACDSVTWNPDYLGPAALNRAWTLVNDQRDADQRARRAAIMSDAGCGNCHSHQSCTELCPNELNPTRSIAGLKRLAMKNLFGGEPS